MKKIRTYTWNNPIETAQKAKSMSGFDFLKATENGEIPPSPLVSTLGFDEYKIDVKKGEVIFYFSPQEYHYNPIGTVHGGVITAVLDAAMGCTVHSLLPLGFAYTTLELKVNFMKAVTQECGKMRAKGSIIHSGKTTALVEADVQDENGKIYAHAVSTCLIMKI
ncbi:hotdog fold thioesterase [Elizabethkingia argentiflava]|uniref:Hotdog fold thioesterase n=1 Tax=Elizabethkingia argenteiflava TaxID=2681556 RepID=A0A845PVK1_9FLAO|nr:PaaI family thioesterase [Elizabethkingia argenteiflava]NAW50328.1 hotdog fold thioesterase [Elizabethkingia argenteiflava]